MDFLFYKTINRALLRVNSWSIHLFASNSIERPFLLENIKS
jgi:hypothetical protein